jgi:hypothetical protein
VTRGKPGEEAKRLLGVDDAVHVFDSQRAAIAYAMRKPGALTLAPNPRRKVGGWGGLIAECRDLPPRRLVADRHVVIELEPGAADATKTQVRELGRELYLAGALSVRCWGRLIARPALQRSLFGGNR